MAKTHHEIIETLKEIVCTRTDLDLSPEDISVDQPLFQSVPTAIGHVEGAPGALGLDSVEALELVVGIEEKFGLAISGEEVDIAEKFYSLATIAEFIEASLGANKN